jgi:hypothetical protein
MPTGTYAMPFKPTVSKSFADEDNRREPALFLMR